MAASRWEDTERTMWRLWAYAARFGHQPLSELRYLSRRDLVRLVDELLEIYKREHPEPKS